MGLLGWFRNRGGSQPDRRLVEWRQQGAAAAQSADHAAAGRLRAELDSWALPDDDVEVEREMLEGLEALVGLSRDVEAAGLPVIATGHRVVGADACHFTAPASMPDEQSQPSGRLLLTSARLIFVGGAGVAVPWHMVAEVISNDRDVLFVHRSRERLDRFRCNSYADAMTAALFGRLLIASRRRAG